MNKFIISLLIPPLALLSWVGMLEWTAATGTKIRLEVEGFDPRDLLAGQYLRYQIVGDSCSAKQLRDTEYCLCFAPSIFRNSHHTILWKGACRDRPSTCQLYASGRCEGSQMAAISRYYIPEHASSSLAQVPKDASIELSVSSGGKAVVTNFYVGQQALAEYLAASVGKPQKP